jgi:hypothetical protein
MGLAVSVTRVRTLTEWVTRVRTLTEAFSVLHRMISTAPDDLAGLQAAAALVSGRHLSWYGPSLAEAPGVLSAAARCHRSGGMTAAQAARIAGCERHGRKLEIIEFASVLMAGLSVPHDSLFEERQASPSG